MLNTVDLDLLHDTQDVTISVNDMASLTEMTTYLFSTESDSNIVWNDTKHRVDDLVVFNFLAEIVFPLLDQFNYRFRFKRSVLNDIHGDYYADYIHSTFGDKEKRYSIIKYISTFHNLDIEDSEVHTILFDVVLWNLYLKGVEIYTDSHTLMAQSSSYLEKTISS